VELNEVSTPWAFWRGALLRSITALELYTTLLYLMIPVPDRIGGPET